MLLLLPVVAYSQRHRRKASTRKKSYGKHA
jgi:hypothetical protein